MATGQEYANYIRSKVSTRSMFEQLAEESAELAQASLKFIRAAKLTKDNPTPITQTEAVLNLDEELHDVLVCFYVIRSLYYEDNKVIEKLKRWAERLGYKDE